MSTKKVRVVANVIFVTTNPPADTIALRANAPNSHALMPLEILSPKIAHLHQIISVQKCEIELNGIPAKIQAKK